MENYGVNYRLEYCDFFGKKCRIDILNKGYLGEILPYSSGEEPIAITFKNDSENKFSQITGSEAKISIMAVDNFSLQTFYVNDERQFVAQYYVNDILKWSGFILPDSANEAFLVTPYESTLQAKDIIGTLKTVAFTTEEGSLISRKESFKNILALCLAKTGLNLDIWTGVNTYETTMPNGLADDPLALTYVDTNRYIDTNNKPYSCYAVILDICNEFSANVKQSDGAWWFVDITQLKGVSYNARHYDYTGAYLGRQTITNNKQAGLNKELELVDKDHSFSNILGYKSVTSYYQYGYLSNKLVNSDFNDVKDDMISLSPFYNWNSVGNLVVTKGQKSVVLPEGTILIDDYYAIIKNKDLSKRLDSDPIAVLKTNTFAITANLGRPKSEADYIALVYINVVFHIVLSAEGESNRFWDGGNWVTNDTTFYVGDMWDRYSESRSLNFSVANPPYNGSLRLGIIGAYFDVNFETPAPTIYFDSISFQGSESQYYKSAIGNVVTASQLGNYSEMPETTTLLFGDDVNKDRTSWMRLADGTPTVVWSRFGKNETLKLQEIGAKNKLNQHQRTSRLFEGTLMGDLNPMDTVNIQLIDSKFFFLAGTFYSKSAKCSVKLAELFNVDLPDNQISSLTYEDFGDFKDKDGNTIGSTSGVSIGQVVTGSGIDLTTYNNEDWDDAYSWGDHTDLYPTLNGVGAYGEWEINIDGSARQWNGHELAEYLNQPVRSTDDVIFKSVRSSSGQYCNIKKVAAGYTCGADDYFIIVSSGSGTSQLPVLGRANGRVLKIKNSTSDARLIDGNGLNIIAAASYESILLPVGTTAEFVYLDGEWITDYNI